MRRFFDLGLGLIDRLILGGSVLIALLSSFFLTQDRLLREWAGFQSEASESLGEFASLNQDVRRRIGTSMTWFPAFDQERLFENDSVFTGENSEASIRLKSGATVDLVSNSLVILKRHSKDFYLDLQLGGLVLNLQKGKAIQLREGNSIAVIEASKSSSSVKLRRNKEGKVSVTALEGQVNMRLNDQGQDIASNNVVEINSNRDLKLVSYPVTLQSPTLGKRIWTEEEGSIKFVWQAIPSANSSYRIQISRQEDFSSHLIQEEVPTTSYSTNLLKSEGIHFWRIQKKKNDESEYSQASRVGEFYLEKIEGPHPNFPFDGLNIITRGKPLDIKFDWKAKGGVAKYRWQLSTDSQFNTILQDKISSTSFIQGIKLEPGDYYWRVKAEEASPLGDKWSQLVHFGIDRKAEAFAENLKSVQLDSVEISSDIPPDQTLEKAAATEREPDSKSLKLQAPILDISDLNWKVEGQTDDALVANRGSSKANSSRPLFKWKKVKHAEGYDVEIAQNETFAKKFSVTKIKGNQMSWQNFEPGIFFWRVRAKSGHITSEFSKLGKIEIVFSAPPIEPMLKVVQKVESPDEVLTKTKSHKLKWGTLPKVSHYELQLSENSQFENESEPVKVEKSNFELVLKPNQDIFFRVRGVNEKQNAFSPYSETGKLSLVNSFSMKTPQIERPDNGVTIIAFGEMENSIALAWSEVPHGKLYRVQFANDPDFRQVIKEQVSEEQSLIVTSADFSNRVYWRVRSEHDKYVSKWSSSRFFSIKKQ